MESITRMSEVANSSDKLSPVWNIRETRIAQWLDRSAQFNEIQAGLEAEHVCILVPELSEQPGSGLSSLAREYAYQHAEDYQMVWWVDASDEVARIIQYTQLCTALDMMQDENIYRFHSVEETQERLNTHAGWLLIFDNVEDVEGIQSLLPESIAGHVIMISSTAVKEENELSTITVPLMSSGHMNPRYDSMTLGDDLTGTSLEGNVLALDLLQAHEVVSGDSAEENLVTVLQALKNIEAPSAIDGLKTVLRYPLNYLSEHDPIAKDFLVLCSFMDPNDIPFFFFEEGEDVLTPQLLEALSSEDSMLSLLTPLLRLGLIQEVENGLTMNPSIQHALHESMPEKALKAWCNAASKLLEKSFPPETTFKYPNPRCIRMLPHLLHAADVAERYEIATQTTSAILFQAGLYSYAHGLVGETHMCYLRSINIAEKVLGTVHPIVALRVNNLGTIEHELGSLDNAQTCFERAIDIFEALYGPTEDGQHYNIEDSMIITPLQNLCSVLEAKGNVNRAQRAFEKAMKTFVKVYGWEHSIVAECAHDFGNTWIKLKNVSKAKNCFMKAVHAEENAYECNNVALAVYLNSLALCFLKEGKPDLALEQLERALRLDQMELDENDLRLSRDYMNLGHANKQLYQYEDAATAYKKALAILEADEGRHRSEKASIQLNLGVILLVKHDFEHARYYLESALALQTEIHGESSTELIPTLVNIGKALDGIRQPIPALTTYERALDLLQKYEPDNHLDRATVLYRIGRSYQHDKQPEAAMEYFEQALSVDTKHAGETHSHVGRDAYAIGSALAKQGDSIVAMGHLTLALDIYESQYGKDHPKTRAVRKKLDGLNF